MKHETQPSSRCQQRPGIAREPMTAQWFHGEAKFPLMPVQVTGRRWETEQAAIAALNEWSSKTSRIHDWWRAVPCSSACCHTDKVSDRATP